jgi:hypothetical protein
VKYWVDETSRIVTIYLLKVSASLCKFTVTFTIRKGHVENSRTIKSLARSGFLFEAVDGFKFI